MHADSAWSALRNPHMLVERLRAIVANVIRAAAGCRFTGAGGASSPRRSGSAPMPKV
jgi:hypothetical protein